MKNEQKNDNKKVINKSFDDKLSEFCRYEPSWGFELSNSKLINSIDKKKKFTPKKQKKNLDEVVDPLQAPNCSILLIGHVNKSLPTQIPIKIKRYERN